MKIAGLLLSLLLLSGCASGGGDVALSNYEEGSSPIAFDGAGFLDMGRAMSGVDYVPATLLFRFTNTAERPQNIERLNVRQGGAQMRPPASFEPASKKVGRMIEPGETFSVEVPVNLRLLPPARNQRNDEIVSVIAELWMGDGTGIRYPVGIPVNFEHWVP